MDTFDTQRAIHAFYQEFPDARGEIFFLDAGLGATLDDALQNLPASLQAECRADETLKAAYAETAPYPYTMVSGDRKAAVIVLPPANFAGRPYHEFLLSEAFRRATAGHPVGQSIPAFKMPAAASAREASSWMQFFFDHETAHAMLALSAPQSVGWRDHALETHADLYAMMRHYKREGTATGFDDAVIKYRAQNLLYVLDHHMTAQSLRKLATERNTLPWAQISAPQLLQESVNALGRHYPTTPQIIAMSDTARRGGAALIGAGFTAALEAFGKAAREQGEFPQTLANDALLGVEKYLQLDADESRVLNELLRPAPQTAP